MGASHSTHEPLDRNGPAAFKRHASLRGTKGEKRSSPRRMERLRRSFRDSFRRRKETHIPEAARPHLWQADELAVRQGTCTFHVKYLGCVEVFESRGMQVCEEALKLLRTSRRRPIKAILFVSGDGLRVVEDETKGLIVDQTIEKVSFCAPDRNNEKGFSYICRDGTTRRWMCHGFLALKETGERLSHAVGCAFAACLERKQKREKELGVTMSFDTTNNTFTRQGSFRQQTLTEKITNEANKAANNIIQVPTTEAPPAPPVAKVNAMTTVAPTQQAPPPPPPQPRPPNPHAIERPHATVSMLMRQGSFRGFNHLSQASPFKRQLSLRISELPSNVERARSLSLEGGADSRIPNQASQPPLIHLKTPVSPIPETSPLSEQRITDPVSAMCQQLSQELQMLTNADADFNSQKNNLVKELFPESSTTTTSLTLATSNVAEFSISSVTNDFLATIDSLKYNNINNNNHHSATNSGGSGQVLTPPATPPPGLAAVPASVPVSAAVAPLSATIAPLSAGVVPDVSGAVVPAPADLPRPEQWLGQVSSAVRKPPALHARTQSVDTYFRESSDWTPPVQPHPTNPFLPATNPAPVKAFEVHM